MRIAYLINQYPKVSHTFIRREILALERQGFEVVRIAVRGWDGELVDSEDERERERTRYILRDGFVPLIFALLRMLLARPVKSIRAFALACRMMHPTDRPFPLHFVYLAEACRLVFWLKSAGVQHLHAHFGTNPAEVAMLAHVLGGPPWSFTVHGPEEFDKPQFIGLAEKIRRCAFAVAISSFGRSQMYRLVNHDHWNKIHVVHCGLEPSFFSTAPTFSPAVQGLVCVGRLCEQKGQLLLIDAVRILRDRGVSVSLTLAGDGELRGVIEELIQRYQLETSISITGWLSSEGVRSQLIGARALVLPSFAEGLPVVIMEAMALKRPVISTFVAGIPELVTEGEQGWLVPAGDIGALVEAIQSCLETRPEILENMGRSAFNKVSKSHDVDKEAAKLAGLFDATRAASDSNSSLTTYR
jgi:colanic acid/amylovoran biosynthesis glycosyltransferase